MKNKMLIYGIFLAGFIAPYLEVTVSKTQNHTASPHLALKFAEAFAGPLASNCDAIIQDANAAAPVKGSYADPVLDHFHFQLYRFNRLETADIELVFCRLTRVLGIDPDLTKLPQTVTKNDPRGHVISVAVTVPTESFAISAQNRGPRLVFPARYTVVLRTRRCEVDGSDQ